MSNDELRTKVIEAFNLKQPETIKALDTMPREWLVGMLACVGVRVAE